MLFLFLVISLLAVSFRPWGKTWPSVVSYFYTFTIFTCYILHDFNIFLHFIKHIAASLSYEWIIQTFLFTLLDSKVEDTIVDGIFFFSLNDCKFSVLCCRYSFAIVGINLTHMAYKLLTDSALKSHMFNINPHKPTMENFHHFYRWSPIMLKAQ